MTTEHIFYSYIMKISISSIFKNSQKKKEEKMTPPEGKLQGY